MNNGEPLAFSLGAANFGVASDSFSFWDMSDEELSAKGNGGLRQMYNYATPDYGDTINTPEDKAVSNTIGNEGMTMDKIIAQREADVSKLVPQQKFNTR
jgi:saccharopine dehydrogenase-like NADP-dependent oxidoreductase